MSEDKTATSMTFREIKGGVSCFDYDWSNSEDGIFFGKIKRHDELDGYYYFNPYFTPLMNCQQVKAVYLKLQELNRSLKGIIPEHKQ